VDDGTYDAELIALMIIIKIKTEIRVLMEKDKQFLLKFLLNLKFFKLFTR